VAAKARGCTIGQAKGHEPEVLIGGSLTTVSPDLTSIFSYRKLNICFLQDYLHQSRPCLARQGGETGLYGLEVQFSATRGS